MAPTFKQFLIESLFTESEVRSRARLEKLAKRLGVKGSDLQKMGETEVSAILKNIGEHDFEPDSDFDAEQLKRGIEVEKEHTKSILVAKLIAKDHLKEDKWYYKKLATIEND
jgi:hypothetical protein